MIYTLPNSNNKARVLRTQMEMNFYIHTTHLFWSSTMANYTAFGTAGAQQQDATLRNIAD